MTAAQRSPPLRHLRGASPRPRGRRRDGRCGVARFMKPGHALPRPAEFRKHVSTRRDTQTSFARHAGRCSRPVPAAPEPCCDGSATAPAGGRPPCSPRKAGRGTLFPAERTKQERGSSALLSEETRSTAPAVTPAGAPARGRLEIGDLRVSRESGRETCVGGSRTFGAGGEGGDRRCAGSQGCESRRRCWPSWGAASISRALCGREAAAVGLAVV